MHGSKLLQQRIEGSQAPLITKLVFQVEESFQTGGIST